MEAEYFVPMSQTLLLFMLLVCEIVYCDMQCAQKEERYKIIDRNWSTDIYKLNIEKLQIKIITIV